MEPALTGASISLLFSAAMVSSGAQPFQSSFGGTTEIQKEIIARSLGP